MTTTSGNNTTETEKDNQRVLDSARTSATAKVSNVKPSNYIVADQQTVTDARTTALAAIKAATTEAEVTAA